MTLQAGSVRTVRVELGARGYDILIGSGLLSAAGEHIAPLSGSARAFVMTDRNVAHHHLETLEASLRGAGLTSVSCVLEPGEATKSLDQLSRALDWLLQAGANRGDVLIALGGGVIGDLAGLTAALMKRGMGLVQVPTTLLAQVDSSVGGKTAINTRQGKNLVGTFYQPRLVIADTATLASLPGRERAAGYAEIVKYGLLGDAGFFDWLGDHGGEVMALEPAALAEAVARSCVAKAQIVAQDEREGGVRALLNLGHTFGHALEAANGYGSQLLHGEAVACGMCMAARYSVRAGLMSASDAARAEEVLSRAGLATRLAALDGGPYEPGLLLEHMKQDKKVRGHALPLILLRGIGRAFVEPEANLDDLLAFLKGEAATSVN
jgi:3-dehydroquinate synthase